MFVVSTEMQAHYRIGITSVRQKSSNISPCARCTVQLQSLHSLPMMNEFWELIIPENGIN